MRTSLEQALKESTEYANSIAKEENDNSLEQVKKVGKTEVKALSKEERLAFKKVLVPVHKKMESRVGADLLLKIKTAIDFNPDDIK